MPRSRQPSSSSDSTASHRSRSPCRAATISMRGSADKVDVADGRIYVTDIKTGREERLHLDQAGRPRAVRQQAAAAGLRLRRLAILDLDLPVTAGYWFVHKDSGRVDLEFDDAVRERYAQVLDVLAAGIAAGLFPARPPAADDFTFVQCAFCNPDGIGYAGRRREWTAKSGHPRPARTSSRSSSTTRCPVADPADIASAHPDPRADRPHPVRQRRSRLRQDHAHSSAALRTWCSTTASRCRPSRP